MNKSPGGIIAATLLLPLGALGAVQTVTTLADAGPGSLRNAIAIATPGDTINFDAGVQGTITLSGGELAISKNLIIAGPGAGLLTLSGDHASRVLHITAGTARISGLTIAEGMDFGVGGGIRNTATLIVNDCVFVDNGAHDGGGLGNTGTLTVTNCTFHSNDADTGGAIYSTVSAALVNSTIATNTASIGGGLYAHGGAMTLLNVTVCGNTSQGGGGGMAIDAGGIVSIKNSLISGNRDTSGFNLPDDVGGAVSSAGFNLIGKTNGSSGWLAGDLKGSVANPLDAMLGEAFLSPAGIPILPLFPGSPAIDAGASGGPATDQRGQARPFSFPSVPNPGGGNGSDIGSFELQSGEVTGLIVVNLKNSGGGSLRQAVANVPFYGFNTVTFAPGLSGTIVLTNGEIAAAASMTISGPGAQVIAVSGNASSRIFSFSAGTVNVTGLTLTNGYSAISGAGISNGTTLNVTNCLFTRNSAADGGGLYNHSAGVVTLHGCTFYTNLSSSGGGLENRGTATLVNSTFSGNRGNNGSAIYSSTLGSLTFLNCTIANNGGGADTYGALYNFAGSTSLKNTLVALNVNSGLGGPDVTGTVTSQGFNLIGKTNNSAGWIASDLKGSMASPLNPLLGPLKDNGGPTPTRALLFGSPAIDKGASGGPALDQRGRVRPYDNPLIANAGGGNGSDIGAFERVPPFLVIARFGSNTRLSWPTNDNEFTLEYAPAMPTTPGSWTGIGGTPAVSGDNFVVTNTTSGAQRHYRLRYP